MMLDNRAADPSQIIADLRHQLDQRTAEVETLIAERDEAIAQQTATAEVLQRFCTRRANVNELSARSCAQPVLPMRNEKNRSYIRKSARSHFAAC